MYLNTRSSSSCWSKSPATFSSRFVGCSCFSSTPLTPSRVSCSRASGAGSLTQGADVARSSSNRIHVQGQNNMSGLHSCALPLHREHALVIIKRCPRQHTHATTASVPSHMSNTCLGLCSPEPHIWPKHCIHDFAAAGTLQRLANTLTTVDECKLAALQCLLLPPVAHTATAQSAQQGWWAGQIAGVMWNMLSQRTMKVRGNPGLNAMMDMDGANSTFDCWIAESHVQGPVTLVVHDSRVE